MPSKLFRSQKARIARESTFCFAFSKNHFLAACSHHCGRLRHGCIFSAVFHQFLVLRVRGRMKNHGSGDIPMTQATFYACVKISNKCSSSNLNHVLILKRSSLMFERAQTVPKKVATQQFSSL